jgi:hypothetical protein
MPALPTSYSQNLKIHTRDVSSTLVPAGSRIDGGSSADPAPEISNDLHDRFQA